MPRVPESLETLDAIDHEVQALRHFEHLGRVDAALVLGISQDARGKRCFRAPKLHKDFLATMQGEWEGP
jgi:hypothetical protein